MYSEGRLVLSSYALNVSLIVFLALLGFVYLFLVNARTTKGFEIKKLEQSIVSLQKQQSELEQQAADLQSIQSLQETVDLPEMVSTTQVEYLGNGDVAYDLLNNPNQ